MRITFCSANLAVDVDATTVDPEVSIGAVIAAITGRDPGPTAFVDGHPVRTTEAVGSLPIGNGSTISDQPATGPGTDRTNTNGDLEPSTRLTMTRVAGDGSGQEVGLPAGTYDIGPGYRRGRGSTARPSAPDDGLAVDPLVRVRVGSHGVEVERLTTAEVLVDGETLERTDVEPGALIETETGVLQLSPGPPARPATLPLVDGGRIPHQRPPRQLGNELGPPPKKPTEPNAPQPSQPFSWIVAVAPLPIGIIAAIFFSPFFLIFLLMTPILTVGRWYESRRRSNRDLRRHNTERAERVREYTDELIGWRRTVEQYRRSVAPSLVRLRQISLGADSGLWERRADHDDFLRLHVGFGAEQLELTRSDFAELNEVDIRHGQLRSVPLAVDLTGEGAIGIVGDPTRRRHLANALLVELAVTHGPADVVLALLIDGGNHLDWDWVKWLPHLEDEHGFRHIATGRTGAARLLAALPRPKGGEFDPSALAPVPMILVDGAQYLEGGFVALSSAVRANAARAVVLADSQDDLPAVCSTVIDVGCGGRLTMTSMRTGQVHNDVLPALVDGTTAASIVRRLSAYRDPERINEAENLPAQCDLRSLVGEEISVGSLSTRWIRPGRTPRGVMGVARDGLLVLDFVKDGPHALIAGTTGAGKSELLRTLIAGLALEQGPDRINFVLIDFKGGGAFDACSELPHTVGVVTDLDEHLAARALRCLRAELKYREQALRAAGVSDLLDYGAAALPFPRLFVVVDEFATLAAELPDFMSSLVDIAQRGRSLGIHMVLATQRPAGVVDAKIRANTNLRISLRVQDGHDSEDVIGDPRAASIDRRSPGRGYVRLGATELTQFQTAIVSRPSAAEADVPIRVAPFELGSSLHDDTDIDTDIDTDTGTGTAAPAGDRDLGGPSDLALLALAAQEATAELGLPAPRVPWPMKVPSEIDAATLSADRSDQPLAVPLGITDIPDEQRTTEYLWSPEVGNLLVYGADSGSTAAVIHTLTIGVGRSGSIPLPHVYVIDFSGGGGLSGLADLAHVGGVVNPSDDERLIRTIDLLEAELVARGEQARTLGVGRLGPAHGVPITLLMIANYGGLAGYLEETNQYELGARVERIVRDGPALGLHVVATANHDRAVPSRLASQIDAKLIMKLADTTAYTAFGLRSRDVPDLGPARAIDLQSGHEVQIARYRSDAISDHVPRESGDSDRPAEIETLGTDIAPGPIVCRSTRTKTGLDLVIGRRHADLEPALLELRPGVDVVVSGPSGSGKTTALRAILAAAQEADPLVRCVVLAEDGLEWPEFETGLPTDLDPGDQTVVVVDGLSAVDDTTARTLAELRNDSFRVMIADRPQRLQNGPMWLRDYTSSRTGLLLQPQPDHGDLFRIRLPQRGMQRLPAGRGYLVNAGVPELIQVVNAGEPELVQFIDAAQEVGL